MVSSSLFQSSKMAGFSLDILGIPVPTSSPSSCVEGLDYEYTILNAELFGDDYALAVEFYMTFPGSVIIYVR